MLLAEGSHGKHKPSFVLCNTHYAQYKDSGFVASLSVVSVLIEKSLQVEFSDTQQNSPSFSSLISVSNLHLHLRLQSPLQVSEHALILLQ